MVTWIMGLLGGLKSSAAESDAAHNLASSLIIASRFSAKAEKAAKISTAWRTQLKEFIYRPLEVTYKPDSSNEPKKFSDLLKNAFTGISWQAITKEVKT